MNNSEMRVILNRQLFVARERYLDALLGIAKMDDVMVIKRFLDSGDLGKGLCFTIRQLLLKDHEGDANCLFLEFKKAMESAFEDGSLFNDDGYYKMAPPCDFNEKYLIVESLRFRLELIDLLLDEI